MKAAITYVKITREEFEAWLNTTQFAGKFFVKRGTVGVYVCPLTENCAIEISSTVGSEDAVMNKGDASIQMRLVSLKTNRVLNKKAQGQSHFKRTVNWRTTLKSALENFVSVYHKSATFYETIASITDREKYEKDIIDKVKSFPNWEQDSYLSRIHKKISEEHGIMTLPEIEALNKYRGKHEHNNLPPKENEPVKPVPPVAVRPNAPALDEQFLNKMRELYKHALKNNDKWLVDFITSVGKQYKERGTISDKQREVVDKGFKRYMIANEILKVADEIEGK